MTRYFHRMYAKIFGYFWVPCPICGEPFGGHEIRDIKTAHVVIDGKSWNVCPKDSCNSEAISRNIGQWYRPVKDKQ